MRKPAWTYIAIVVRWVDGDTLDVVIDLGFRMATKQRLRLFGLDCPERGSDGWEAATHFSTSMAPPGTSVLVKTHDAPEKYGRYLAEIYIDGQSINDALIDAGHAALYGKR